MPLTLVTGANSFVAAHVIHSLITAGHTVIGTVRRASAGEEVLKLHPEWEGKLSFVEVPDYAVAGAFDEIFKSQEIDYIAHVASPMFADDRNADYDKDWLKPAVEGNLSLLRSAKAFGKSIKHISITGSINALTDGSDAATRTFTNESWNNITQEQAREANNGYISYVSIKKEAELAVWKFLEEEKPTFGITVFLPALIFGPTIQPVKSVSKLTFSADLFYSLFDGRNETVPQTMFPSYIDVRDLADAHVKALTTPGAKNKRFLLGGFPLTFTAIVRTIAELVKKGELPAEAAEKLPKESGEEKTTPVPKIEAEEGNKVLGIKFRTLEETVRDTVANVLEIKATKG